MRQELEIAMHIILWATLEEVFRKTITEKWHERMRKCIAHEGRYFEKENEIETEDEEETDDDDDDDDDDE